MRRFRPGQDHGWFGSGLIHGSKKTSKALKKRLFRQHLKRLIDTYTEALWSAANNNGRTGAVREEAAGLAEALKGKDLVHLFLEGTGTSRDQRREL